MTAYPLLQLLQEGGWATTATQKTQITPATVRASLHIMQQLVQQFNQFLKQHADAPPQIKLGSPTGSGYYHDQDVDTKEYGDIDLQMIADNPWRHSHSTYSSEWNHLWDEWVARQSPAQVDAELSTPGHPILKIPGHGLVQVDFMWHEPDLADWGLARSVPPQGVKGLLNGNLFSVLGHMLQMSMQHSGAQVKMQAGSVVPFSKQKGVQLITITKNPRTLFLDVLSWVADQSAQQLKLNPLLTQNPGVKWPKPELSVMVKGIKGLAQAFEDNQLFGKGVLQPYESAQDFLQEFWRQYEAKAQAEIHNPKRLKAETPAAQARAQRDIHSIQQGLAQVQQLWHN